MPNIIETAGEAIVNEAEAIGTAIKNEFAPVETAVVADVQSALASTEALITRNGDNCSCQRLWQLCKGL